MILDFEERAIEPDITVLELKGRMHLGNRLSDAEWAAKQILAAGKRKLILDITGVDSIDSAALGMLLLITGDMNGLGGSVIVAGANARAINLFQMTHVENVLRLQPSLDAAVQAFSAT
jgi:anti-sigma B factor antagonist